jgi:hypothetical protein
MPEFELEFKQYSRKGLSEMRPFALKEDMSKISVSPEDLKLETLIGGYVARNPKNHADQWYVSRKYFNDNLQEVTYPELDKEEQEVIAEISMPDMKECQSEMDWDGDGFLLISQDQCEEKEGSWSVTTRAMQINGVGCIVKTSTIINENVSDALVFVPGVKLWEGRMENKVVSREIVVI